MATRTRRPDRNGSGSELVEDVRSQTLEHLSGTPVRVTCRDGTTETVYVGKLCIDQLVAIGRLADRVRLVLSKEQVAEVKEAVSEAAAESAQLEAGFAFIMGLLDAETISVLFGILVDKPAEWCRANLGAADMLAVADAVLEHNSWAEVVAAFRRAARRLRASSDPSST